MKQIMLVVLCILGLQQYSYSKDSFFGVHQDILWESTLKEEDITLLIDRMEELGVGSIRMPIRWLVVSSGDECLSNAPGIETIPHEQNIADYRHIIDAIPNDIEILAYLSAPPEQCKDLYFNNPVVFGKRYKKYVELVVSRFKYRIRHFEIWNEENSTLFSLRPPYANAWSAWDYVNHILAPGYSGVKNIDATAKVVMGGTVYNGVVGHGDIGGFAGSIGDDWYLEADFIDSVYNAMSSLPTANEHCPTGICFDILATHPYWYSILFPQDNNYYEAKEQTYGAGGTRSVMNQHGDTNTDIWWTEIGERVDGDFGGNPIRQAENLNQTITDAQSYRDEQSNQNRLGRLFWFQLRDSTINNYEFGLMDVNSVRRPAFYAYKDRIFEFGKPASIIDDFDIQLSDTRIFSEFIWETSCSDLDANCKSLFFGDGSPENPNSNGTLLFPTKNLPWHKIAINTRRTIPFDDESVLHFSGLINSFGFNGDAPNGVFAIISIGGYQTIKPDSINDAFKNGMHLFLRRISDDSITVKLESADENNRYIHFEEPFSAADLSWMLKVDLKIETSGEWSLTLKDSTGMNSFVRSSDSNAAHHANFPDEIGLRFMGMTSQEGVGGRIKIDDIKLVSLNLPNEIPTANAGVNQIVSVGENVVLNGSSSYDHDGSIDQYVWVQSSGIDVVLSGMNTAMISFTAPDDTSLLSFTLTVTDNRGATQSDTVTVNVQAINKVPVLSILTPADDISITQGDPLVLTGTAVDDEDGDISDTLLWASDLDGELGSGSTLTINSLNVGSHLITASATDSGGLSNSSTVSVIVEEANTNIEIISASFNILGSPEGFAYFDDGLNQSDEIEYADGQHIVSEDCYSEGCLRITIGGIDDEDKLDLSGAWQNPFVLSSAQTVNVSLRFRLEQSGSYESDEHSKRCAGPRVCHR